MSWYGKGVEFPEGVNGEAFAVIGGTGDLRFVTHDHVAAVEFLEYWRRHDNSAAVYRVGFQVVVLPWLATDKEA